MLNSTYRICWSTATLVALAMVQRSHGQVVVPSEWNVGNGAWNVATNWLPNDVPDNGGGFTYNVQIGNLAPANVAVTFVPEDGTSDTITSLDVTDSANLSTNGFQLLVIGQTTVNGVGTSINVDPHATPGTIAFNTDNLDLTGSGQIVMRGGILDVDVLMEINALSAVQGHGTIVVGDVDLVVEEALENSGVIRLTGGVDAPQTLILQTNGVDTIDLDGDTDAGVLEVNDVVANANFDTTTLVVDAPLSDAFSGTMQIGQRDTVTFNDNFTMSGADLQMDGGTHTATMNGPGDVTGITSSAFTITGNAVIANDMTFSGTLNTIVLTANSSLTLNGTVAIADASALDFTAAAQTLIIGGDTSITEAAGDFDWDNTTTLVNGSGNLALAVDQIDIGNDIYTGALTLNDGGDVSVNVTAAAWEMDGVINKIGASVSTISGDRMLIGGNVNANTGTLDLPSVTLQSTASVSISVAGTLTLGSASEFAGPALLTGAGLLRMEGTSTVSANTTVGVATFDWDGNAAGSLHTINNGVVFTINSPTFDTDGDMDDAINLGGNGAQLLVNGSTSWTATGAINANTALAGTATIGGTSRLILSGASADLNVDGNTTITAPLTFGASSSASVDAAMILNANGDTIYAGGTISGAGTYDPGPTNTVTDDFLISSTNFNFDAGNWTVENGALLTVNVGDYEPDAGINAFDTAITLNGGEISVNTSDVEFVMDGVLNLHSTSGHLAGWIGESVDIGNDSGVLDADLNVTGVNAVPSHFGAFVDFNSDADVNVAAGGRLAFLTDSIVNFDTVNGANNAEFTGPGTIEFNGFVNVNEAVTLNMVGGTVDLDGSDSTGEFINIDAPLTINAATMDSFGKLNGGGGVNTLDVNNSVGTGVLTVNLDNASHEWTLNAPGVMNLVNDNAEATLLAGSDVNIDGAVNVTGDVRTTARLDFGPTAVVNINTSGEPLRLAGGNNINDPNTISGGTISGVGLLGADPGIDLIGFGAINAGIAFNGASLFADNGTLTINSSIVFVNRIGTDDDDGVLNVANPWNTNVAGFVTLAGGTLQGGTMTIDNPNGVSGFGLITSRLVNNTRLRSADSTLVVQTAANDNDWDGVAGAGRLTAINGGILEIRDVGPAFGFIGTAEASAGGRVFSNGFALDFDPGSTLSLASGGKYQSTSSTDLGGTVTIGAGGATIEVANNSFLTFETGSATTLGSNLQLLNNNINIEAGATFGGGGALIVPDGSNLVADANANIGVLLDMQGAFRPANSDGVGRVDVTDYQQSNTGKLFVDLTGTGLNQFDRLVVGGDALLDGYLNIDIDGGFVPAVGNTFNIITANTVSGEFDFADVSGMPAGLTFHIEYLANAVQLQVVNEPFFSADFDDDGDVDATDLSIWRGAFNLNQLGDADGDNDSDGNDFLTWQRQAGSAPGGRGRRRGSRAGLLGAAGIGCVGARLPSLPPVCLDLHINVRKDMSLSNPALRLLVVMLASQGLLCSSSRAVSLTVHNPSFEAPTFADGGFAFGVSVAQQGGRGWNFSFDGGFIYNPQAGDYIGAAGNGAPQGATGAQVGGVFGGGDYSIFQTLTGADGVLGNSDDPVVEIGMVYTLTFAVGQRAIGNPFGATYGGYNVELLAGDTINPTVLGGESDSASPPPPGTFVTRSIVVASPAYDHPESIGQPLTIRLRKAISSPTATVEYDHVRVDAVKVSPELNADFTENGVVDGNDLAAWRTNYGAIRLGATHEHGNANGDDVVDGTDFLAWQRQLGGVPAVVAGGAVPEPGAWGLAVMGAAALTAGRSRFDRSGGRC